MTEEKRQHLRWLLDPYVPVTEGDAGEALGEIVNLTTTGMMLTRPTALEVGQHLHLQIPWQQPNGTVGHIKLEAEVRWCRADSVNRGFFNCGFRFIDPAPEIQLAIQRVIQEHSVSRLTRPRLK